MNAETCLTALVSHQEINDQLGKELRFSSAIEPQTSTEP